MSSNVAREWENSFVATANSPANHMRRGSHHFVCILHPLPLRLQVRIPRHFFVGSDCGRGLYARMNRWPAKPGKEQKSAAYRQNNQKCPSSRGQGSQALNQGKEYGSHGMASSAFPFRTEAR